MADWGFFALVWRVGWFRDSCARRFSIMVTRRADKATLETVRSLNPINRVNAGVGNLDKSPANRPRSTSRPYPYQMRHTALCDILFTDFKRRNSGAPTYRFTIAAPIQDLQQYHSCGPSVTPSAMPHRIARLDLTFRRAYYSYGQLPVSHPARYATDCQIKEPRHRTLVGRNG